VFCVKFLETFIIAPSVVPQIALLLKNMTTYHSIVSKGWLHKGSRGKYKTGNILSKNFSPTTGKILPLHSPDGGRPRFSLPKSEVAAV
jgi:hypothetical protein